MPPPMFSPQPIDDTPQQYLHRARMFMQASMALSDYCNSEQNWPKYALLTHAIELALKGFVRHKRSVRTGEPKQHDLSAWYRLALQNGLPINDPTVVQNIDILNELHSTHYTRYPQHRSTPLPEASVIADSTAEHLIFVITQVVFPRT